MAVLLEPRCAGLARYYTGKASGIMAEFVDDGTPDLFS
jgi:hypothetical protein